MIAVFVVVSWCSLGRNLSLDKVTIFLVCLKISNLAVSTQGMRVRLLRGRKSSFPCARNLSVEEIWFFLFRGLGSFLLFF